MSYSSWSQLRMAALDRPRSGNMEGINSINYACYREVGIRIGLQIILNTQIKGDKKS